MGNRAVKSIAVAGTILVEKNTPGLDLQLQKFSCTGCVPNVAVMLKEHSANLSVAALGNVGADERGEYALRCLQSAGVHTGGIRLVEGGTTGFRENTAHKGAVQSFGVGDVIFRNLNCNILHLGHFLNLDKIDSGDGRRILKHAKHCGMQTSVSVLGGDSRRYGAVLVVLPYVDYLIVSLEDGAKLANIAPNLDNLEKIARRLLWHGVRKKVFIQSEQWLACCTRTRYYQVGNYILPTEEVSSQEQKFDAFCAGVLTGIAKGWDELKILEFASACAAVTQCGAEEVKTIPQIEKFCKTFSRNKKVL